jgi:hypothetical protein
VALSLQPAAPNCGRFAVSVLNTDRRIELVGAPALTVQAKNLQLQQPEEGFVLLRNNYEYLINIPDQYRARPGLFGGKAAADVPARYAELSACFGDKNPETYYGHPRTCPCSTIGSGQARLWRPTHA